MSNPFLDNSSLAKKPANTNISPKTPLINNNNTNDIENSYNQQQSSDSHGGIIVPSTGSDTGAGNDTPITTTSEKTNQQYLALLQFVAHWISVLLSLTSTGLIHFSLFIPAALNACGEAYLFHYTRKNHAYFPFSTYSPWSFYQTGIPMDKSPRDDIITFKTKVILLALGFVWTFLPFISFFSGRHSSSAPFILIIIQILLSLKYVVWFYIYYMVLFYEICFLFLFHLFTKILCSSKRLWEDIASTRKGDKLYPIYCKLYEKLA